MYSMEMGLTPSSKVFFAFILCLLMLLLESSAHEEVNFSNMLQDIKIVSGEIGVVDWYQTEKLTFSAYTQSLHWFRFTEDDRVVSLYDRYCLVYNPQRLDQGQGFYSRIMSWFRHAVADPAHLNMENNMFLHTTCKIATYMKGLYDVNTPNESESGLSGMFDWVAGWRFPLSGTTVEPTPLSVEEPQDKHSYSHYIIQKMDPRQWKLKDYIKLCLMLLMTVVFTKAFNAFIVPQFHLLWYIAYSQPKMIKLQHERWASERAVKAAEQAKFEDEKQVFYEENGARPKQQAPYAVTLCREVMAYIEQLKQEIAQQQYEINVLDKELIKYRQCILVKGFRILEAENGEINY